MKKSLKWLAVAYGAALAAWLLLGCVGLARSAYYESRGLRSCEALAWNELMPVSLKEYETDKPGLWYVSTDSDPQLHWTGDAYLQTVVLRVQPQKPPLGVVLYWKSPGQQDFSERQSVYAVQTAPGEYTFELGALGRRVQEIRIDPDSVGAVIARFDGVQLNPPRPWYAAFAPGWQGVLLLLAAPPLALAALAEAKAVFARAKKLSG